MENFKEKLGQTIRELRLEQKKTRASLANDAKISSKFLYEVEVGKKGVSVEVLYYLANTMGTSVGQIIDIMEKSGEQR